MAKDLTRHEALEAADDLGLALPFVRPPLDVVEGRLVGAHAGDHHAVEGSVGLPVPAAVEPVPAGLAARGRDRAGAAQLGEGGLGADAFRVVANQEEHLHGGAGLDAVRLDYLRRTLLD